MYVDDTQKQGCNVLAQLLGGLLGVAEGVLDKSPVPVADDSSAQHEAAELRLPGHMSVKVSVAACQHYI